MEECKVLKANIVSESDPIGYFVEDRGYKPFPGLLKGLAAIAARPLCI